MALAEGHRGRQAQGPARRDRRSACRLLGFVEIGQQLHAVLIEHASALGQRKPPRRAIEQTHVEVRLELGDVARNGGDRSREPLGGADEAAALDDLGECRDGLQAIHPMIIAYLTIIICQVPYLSCY